MKPSLLLGPVFATTVFLSAAQAADFHVLHDFDTNDGTYPNGNLVLDKAGNLWGTAAGGGEFSGGTIFKLSAAGEFSVVHAFTGGADGREPESGLTFDPSTGNFYGTTTGGGAHQWGGIFRVTPAGELTPVHDFDPDKEGDNPLGTLTRDRRGYFYGTLSQDGPGAGTVFALTPEETFKILHVFGHGEGGQPQGRLEQHGANLFGVNLVGGSGGSGTIYKVRLDGTFSLLWTSDKGIGFGGGVARDDTGNLYGTSFWDHGAVYWLNRKGALKTLHAFTGGADGLFAYGDMVLTKRGMLYGAATRGGTGDHGTLFRVDLQGNFTLLHSFTGTDGSNPSGGLTRGRHGILYGTTLHGGSHGNGVLFSVAGR